MDIPRPSQARQRRIRRAALGAGAVLALAFATIGVSRLKPAAPSVERASLWIDTVKRGEMIREVRGVGTLVPVEIRWIPAVTEGRVERLVLQPGTPVARDSVILDLVNPELDLAVLDAESQARAARAQYTELRVRLSSQRLDQEAASARVQAEYSQARLRADMNEKLAASGLVADLDLELARVTAAEAANRHRIEEERLAINGESVQAQLDAKRIEVEQKEALARLKRSQHEALHVRAGMDGVLQQVPVEVGQRVAPGTNLARVAQLESLKAVVKVPETQARDIQIGQKATVDTRNGVVAGRVARVDPAVQNGTVSVDVAFEGTLPKGARPDLTVDGTIELERLDAVLRVGRPALGQEGGELGLFRLEADGTAAGRVRVRLGRTSVNAVEIVGGLAEGDRVILSDTSAWDAFDRIRLK
jgi:HlyD family secretion protein